MSPFVLPVLGYGNMSPSTTAGQIFCVFFALFGIPLNMVVLNRVGKYMLAIERKASDFIQGKTNHRVSALPIDSEMVTLYFTAWYLPCVLYSLEVSTRNYQLFPHSYFGLDSIRCTLADTRKAIVVSTVSEVELRKNYEIQ